MQRQAHLFLFISDLALYTVALALALWLRHFELPTLGDIAVHWYSFLPLFVLWFLVFETVGLYDRHVVFFERKLSATIVEAQVVNFAIAAAYFFLVPLEVQPKTVLVLFFSISTLMLIVWRLGGFLYHSAGAREESVVVVGSGPDIERLVTEMRESPHALLRPIAHVASIEEAPRGYTLVVDPRLGVPRGAYDAAIVYEQLMSRIPLSLIDVRAFEEYAMRRTSRAYDALKRVMDIMIALVIGIIFVILLPLVTLLIWLEDRGAVYITQTRVGRGGRPFSMFKFRTMTGNDNGAYQGGKSTLRVTAVGAFLRKSRIDELPQLLSVLVGTQSLIGPRPELPALTAEYERQIPAYRLRYLVAPGLSGWAQLYHQAHPHHGSDVEQTQVKVSYDLYYIKHRSLILDLDIALKTIKTVVQRVGA